MFPVMEFAHFGHIGFSFQRTKAKHNQKFDSFFEQTMLSGHIRFRKVRRNFGAALNKNLIKPGHKPWIVFTPVKTFTYQIRIGHLVHRKTIEGSGLRVEGSVLSP